MNLNQKSKLNLINYFLEFFILSTIFNSAINNGNIASNILKKIPLLNKNLLSLTCLFLLTISTIIRVKYAKKLNAKLENSTIKKENSNINDSTNVSKKISKQRNLQINNNLKRKTGFYQLNQHNSNKLSDINNSFVNKDQNKKLVKQLKIRK